LIADGETTMYPRYNRQIASTAPYQHSKAVLLFALPIIVLPIVWWFTSEPMPQDLLYHDFADQRALLGIPHALNVLSNGLFLLAGIWGMNVIQNNTQRWSFIERAYWVFFLGIALISIGSAYYHWSPDNSTLVWDRLPMTIAFMTFTVIVIFERYNESLGKILFPLLLIAGILSVAYWVWQDDLRPYLAVQFGPMIILPFIIWRYSGSGTRWLWLTLLCYAAAKALEVYDQSLIEITQGSVSGHTLKHLVAATGALMMVTKFRLSNRSHS
jgi:hypothetical protein